MSKSHGNEVQMLGVSHSGIRLIKQSQTTTNGNTLQVFQTFPFDVIEHVSSIRDGSMLDLRLMKKCITIHSYRVYCLSDNRKQQFFFEIECFRRNFIYFCDL